MPKARPPVISVRAVGTAFWNGRRAHRNVTETPETRRSVWNLSAWVYWVMINVSEMAAAKISELLVEEQKAGGGLRVYVQGGGCSGFQYGMMIEENGQGAGDQVFESHGIKLFVDPISVQYLKNAEVDFIDTITGGGFTIKNPNATSTCGCGSSFSTE